MRGADGRAQFLTEVFPAELEEVRRRRQAAESGQPEPEPGPPDARRGLIGLALSGGGIRSATFGLGVVQALAGGGFLKLVDYLSTVSGGGFIGACLSSVLNSPDTRAEGHAFPLRFEAGREEPTAVVHLRNSGNYLAPAGLLDKFRLAAVVLRGILLNLILFLPWVMLAVALTEIVHELGRSLPAGLRYAPLLALAGFLVLVVTFPLISKLLLRRLTWKGRNAYERLIAAALLATLAIMSLVPIVLLIDGAIRLSWEDAREWIVYEAGNAFETDDPTHWLVPIVVLAALLLTVWAARRAARWRGRIVLYALGVLGPLVLFAVYLTLCVFQIDSPVVRSRTLVTFHLEAGAGPEALEERLQEALAAAGEPPGGSPTIEPLAGARGWRLVDERRQHALLIREDAGEHHVRVIHDLVGELDRGWFSDGLRHEFESRGLTIPPPERRQVVREADGWRIADSATGGGYQIQRDGDRLTFVDMQADLWDDGDEAFTLVGLGLLLFSFLFVNINQTSSHGFYRDRLSRAYLLGAHEFLFGLVLDTTAELDANRLPDELVAALDEHGLSPGSRYVLSTLEPGRRWRLEIGERTYTLLRDGQQTQVFRSLAPNDSLRLSELRREGTVAPYHLINVALNLQGSKDPGLRGRNADFFLFAKRHTGGNRTGYCPTEELEQLDRQLDLGTAMAVSAAAAAPNMGATTIRPLVFVLTLLNIRLGYWLPNPGWIRSGAAWRRLVARTAVGPLNLVQEALGRLDDEGAFVNLSDGGHLENLGIFELLRRRCRLIVAIDAEADPGHTFGGLVKLMRLARIDLGVEIEVDLERLRRDAQGRSAAHWALGKILYGRPDDGETGYLLYLKASVTGDEGDDLLDYQARFPDFPHQSTAGQFFSEDQFEAYRSLGHHAAAGMLAGLAELAAKDGADPAALRDLLGQPVNT